MKAVPPSDVTFDALERFCAYAEDELQRSPRTVKCYRQAIVSACRITQRELTELDLPAARIVKREKSLAPNTRHLMIVALKHVHKWALLEEEPWADPRILALTFPQPKHAPRAPLTVQQARTMLGACRLPLEFRVVYLGLYAGCRIGESAAMSPAHVRGDRLVFIGKGSKERTVPIHNHLASRLSLIFSEGPSSPGVLQSSLKRLRDRIRAVDEAGRVVTGHTLRRTFANELYDRLNTPREVVAALLGHGDSVTHLYAPVRYDKLRAAVDRLSYYSGRMSMRLEIGSLLEPVTGTPAFILPGGKGFRG